MEVVCSYFIGHGYGIPKSQEKYNTEHRAKKAWQELYMRNTKPTKNPWRATGVR